MSLKPEDCPRYESCNANFCPLDEKRMRRRHLSGEPVCFWLREWSKVGGPARIEALLPYHISEGIGIAHFEILTTQPRSNEGRGQIKKVLQMSARTGSKLESAKRLNEIRWKGRTPEV